MARLRTVMLALGLVVSIGELRPAHAADPASVRDTPEKVPTRRVEWQPNWHKVRWWENGIAAAGWGVTITSGYVLPDTPFGWRGRNGFDEGVRDGLLWSSPNGRATAASVSDVMFYSLAAFPIVVDGMIVTWGVHKKPDVALQLVLTDIEALGVAGMLSSITERTGRERPYVRTCPKPENGGSEPSQSLSPEGPCAETGRNQSFVSGHTAAAFAGAGLICFHHQNLPLFGSRAADVATCSAALGAAGVAGYLRLAADTHYATDVLAAAAIGLGSGYVLPTLLRFGMRGSTNANHIAVRPNGGRDTIGLTLQGTFL
jgi:membrane-associated phospholipid phosphatase